MASALSSPDFIRRKLRGAGDRQAHEDREPGDEAEQHGGQEVQRLALRRHRHAGRHRGAHLLQAIRCAGVLDRGDQARRHAVGVFDVIHHVTVHEPRPGLLIGGHDDVDALSGREGDRVLHVARFDRLRVARDHLLIVTVRVHRMNVFGRQADPANAEFLALFDVHGVRRRIFFAVDRPMIFGRALNFPTGQHLDEVVGEMPFFRPRVARPHDDRTVQPGVELGFVHVRVVHERARGVGGELILVVAMLRHQRLRDAGYRRPSRAGSRGCRACGSCRACSSRSCSR